ncbi:MAG TPA: DUF2194 domain-containing protein, partial [Oscillospiraceae bacterium]|nr:DUF2194 domain-containing protein [Oscillospiraceae bacterium]
SIVSIFLVIFLMFISFALVTDSLAGANFDTLAGSAPSITVKDALLEDFFNEEAPGFDIKSTSIWKNRRAALIVSGPKDTMADMFEEWCFYNKYRYKVFMELPSVEEIQTFDVVLFGEPILGEESLEVLEGYGTTGVPIIFTRLPSFQTLDQYPQLADFFGIKKCVNSHYQIDGIKIFADFFLSRERIYVDDDHYNKKDDMTFELPYYTLRPGYEVYAVGVLQKQGQIKDEDLPPLLWRTYSDSSLVFVVNSEIFSGKSMLGIITAFLSQAYEVYIYPVVNGHTVAILNYPNFADENNHEIMTRYTRTPRSFKWDILWPNITKVLKNYDQSYDFFALPGLNIAEDVFLHSEDVSAYWKEIVKLGGTVGLSLKELSAVPLDQILAFNGDFFQEILPDYQFTALYGGDFSLAELALYFKNQLSPPFEDVSLVLANFQEGERFFQYLDDKVLALLITGNGYKHENSDDLQMIALETALGFCIQQVDIARALFPERDEDNWNLLAERWSAVKTYYNDFQAFDGTSIYELEDRVRQFLALNYHWKAEKNQVEIGIDNLQKEAWFILRIHNAEIEDIAGGIYKKISPGAYLIHAEKTNVTIELRETDYLPAPVRS